MLKGHCLETVHLRRYIDDRLDSEERRLAEAHLSDCGACRDGLVELYLERDEVSPVHRAPESLKQAARGVPKRRAVTRRRGYLAAAAVLAVALGLATLRVDDARPPSAPTGPGALRDPEAPSELLAITPRGAVAMPVTLELRWSAVPGTRRYTATVLDSLGNIVRRESAQAERLELEPASLVPGAVYFWYVNAELEDGLEVQSEIVQFRLTGQSQD